MLRRLLSPWVRMTKLRVIWTLLPLLAGPLAAAGLDTVPRAPRLVLTALLWAAWGIGLVSVLAPRPVGLTALRIITPGLLIGAIISAAAASSPALWIIVLGVGVCVGLQLLVTDTGLTVTAVNGLAYGDERRYPLRTPPGLYLAPLPLARALVIAGVVTGPVAAAANEIVIAAIGFVVGIPLAVIAARSLHTLSRRWVVLVPAGVVIVDPLTIADPVLVVRQHIHNLRGPLGTDPVPSGALDLRLGASWGTVVAELDGETDLVRTRRGHGETLQPNSLVVAVVNRNNFLIDASQRRIPVVITPTH